MNRDDTRRYRRWMFLRRHARRAMLACLVLAAAWAAMPLALQLLANPPPLAAACQQTPGCMQARLCSGWREVPSSPGPSSAAGWRPELDVCMTGRLASGTASLAPGTTKAWLPAWLRPLLSDHNRIWWRPSS